jgi:hypothetical protein
LFMATIGLWASPGAANGPVTFNTADYGSGTFNDESYCWRGFVFGPNEDVTVAGLIGGAFLDGQAGLEFQVAIWEGAFDDVTGEVTIGTLVASAVIPEGDNQVVALPAPITLTGQEVYVIGTGVTSGFSGDPGYYEVEDFDSSTIADESGLLGFWAPDFSQALSLGICEEDASEAVGETRSVLENTTESIPAIGFTDTVDPEPTTTTTTPAPNPTTTVPNAPTTTVPNTTPVPNQPVVTPRFTG